MKTKSQIQRLATQLLTGFSPLPKCFTLTLFATVCSLQSRAQTSEEMVNRSFNPPACIANLAQSMGTSNWSIISQWNSLENQYCERMQVGFFDSAFSTGKDLPAEKLNTDWQEPAAVATDPKIDSSVILDFNKQAKNLWDDLVKCHGSAENARQAYLKLSDKCGLDKKIQNYNFSVQSFLMTSSPPTKGSYLGIRFHPLFTEILLENANATSWIPAYDSISNSELRYYYGLIIKFIVEGHTLNDLNAPEKNREIELHYYALTRIKDEVDLQGMMAVKFRQINAIRYLEMNVAIECASLGLWPGVSRVVVHELSKDSENYDIGSEQLVTTYMKACGDFRYTNHSYSGNSRASFGIVKDFRKLAIRFSKK